MDLRNILTVKQVFSTVRLHATTFNSGAGAHGAARKTRRRCASEEAIKGAPEGNRPSGWQGPRGQTQWLLGGFQLHGIGAIVTKCRKDNFCRECGALRPYNAKLYCAECDAARLCLSRAKHKILIQAWMKANKNYMNWRAREWQKKHPLRKAAAVRRWAMANREHLAIATAARGKLRREATPRWANKFFVLEIYRLAALRSRNAWRAGVGRSRRLRTRVARLRGCGMSDAE